MSQEKKRKQQLKGPDLLQAQAYAFMDWAQKNSQVLIKIAVPIVVVAVVATGWYYFSKNQTEKRRGELALVDDIRYSELDKLNEKREEIQKQITELRDADKEKQDKLKEDKKEGEEEKKFVANPKIKELEDQIKALKADHAESLGKYLEFAKTNAGTPSGWRAKTSAANIYLDQKDFNKAYDLLKEIHEASVVSDFYQVYIGMLFVSVCEQLKKWDEALTSIDKVLDRAKTNHEHMLASALWTKGRVLKGSGKLEESKKVLQTLINDHATSEEGQKARAAIALW